MVLSDLVWKMSFSLWSSSSMLATGLLFTVITAPLGESSIPSTTWLLGGGGAFSGWGGLAWGSAMSRPFWASGVTTMKMMSSTSITSMRGVMLMSDMAPLDPGRVASWEWTIQRRCLTLGAAGVVTTSEGGAGSNGGLGFLNSGIRHPLPPCVR